MKTLIKQFVDNIMENSLAEAKDCFNLIISKKIDEQLSTMRKEVANTMLRTAIKKVIK